MILLYFFKVQLAVDRDLIYAIGGMENGGYTSTVEVYDPVQQIWSEVDSMSQARCNPGKKYVLHSTLTLILIKLLKTRKKLLQHESLTPIESGITSSQILQIQN